MVNHMVQQLRTDDVFAALGDERRLVLVDALTQGERTVSDLAGRLPISLTGTLKHLGVLERAGVVSRSKRGRTVTVRLEPEALAAVEEWALRTRSFWTGALDALARHVEEPDPDGTARAGEAT